MLYDFVTNETSRDGSLHKAPSRSLSIILRFVSLVGANGAYPVAHSPNSSLR